MFCYRRLKETLDSIIDCLEAQDVEISVLTQKIERLEKKHGEDQISTELSNQTAKGLSDD